MMSRLTKNHEGDYYYPQCFEKCGGLGTSEKCNECEFNYAVCKKLGEYEDLEEKVIRTRELNCDESQEIRTVLKRMHEILEEAIETNACGNENELSRMVEAYLPNIEQSYKYFIERMVGVKHE